MNLNEAEQKADQLVELLTPFCDRIQVAGSIRRGCIFCRDIEIVCIPSVEYVSMDLFGNFENCERSKGFVKVVNSMQAKKGDAVEGKYMCRLLPNGTQVDIFTATPENWGYILAIRTGSAKYSANLAGRWVAKGFKGIDGNLTRHGEVVPIWEEKELFDALDLAYVEPEESCW